jgi:hypothetical protein
VLDGVGLVWARFFEDLLEVLHRQSCLPRVVAYGLCGVLRARAACLLIDVAAVVDHGLIAALFAPFLASLGILLGTLDCGSERRLPVTAWYRSKPCGLGMVGGGGTPFFSCTVGGSDRCIGGRSGVPLCT